MSAPEGDKNNPNNKTTFGAIDLAPKVLVRPTEKANIFTGHSTYRTISPNMRLVLPQGSTLPSNYIRQTINIRPDNSSATTTRAQITALPARTITQTSITVSQAGQRCTIAATPIRTPPVSISNLSTGIFRPANPTSRTSSPSATLISQTNAGNWNTVQVPTQIIRATSIPTGPRPRVVTQISTNQGTQNLSNATITANVISQVTSQSNQQQINQVVGNQPTYVATLATVLPPQKTATLLYTNPQQPYSTGNNQQRLTLATTMAAQRHIRPTIQRLPTANIRVNTSNINIRQPSTPILTQTNVLTTIPNTIQRPATSTISATNLTGSIPARIIQVQQQGLVQPQQSGTTTQVINARGNLMTLQPVFVNNNRAIVNNSGLQQGLTIAHLGKISSDGQNSASNLTTNLPPGSTIQTVSNQSNNNSATIISGNLITTSQSQQNPQQITQIVNLNQNQAPQIITVTQSQILSSQNQSGTTTMVPLAIAATSRNAAIPVSVATLSGQNQIIVSSVRGLTTTTSTTGNITSTTMPTILPIAKVLPQINAPIISNQDTSVTMSVAQSVTGPSVFIQARPPHTSISAIQQSQQQPLTVNKALTVVSNQGGTTFLPTSQAFYYEHVPVSTVTNSQSVTTTTVTTTVAKMVNAPFTLTSTSATNMSNTNTTSSFVAVPTSNRNLIHGMLPAVSASVSQAKLSQIQTIPVRINQIIGQQQQNILQPQQIIVPASTSAPQHLIIQGPLQGKGSSSPRGPSILRKRDNSPIKAKNLTEALMAMGKDRNRDRELSPHSRSPSTDGSTTVSATSSPGIEQQEREGMAFTENNRCNSEKIQFKPVDEGYPPVTTTTTTTNGNLDHSPRKKVRKQLNMSDLSLEPSEENRATGAIPKPVNNIVPITTNNVVPVVKEEVMPLNENNNTIAAQVAIKKPTTSLLQSYKQSWKAANNHFQRYSDVRKRDERPPSVIDMANQAHVLQKVNGWKIYHLSSQIEDLSDLETQAYDKLNQLLSSLEKSAKPTPELERINDLLKGNMQRSKIIIDGINDARTQIMKIFDHKTHVSDIIHRCASKRNFKKREKL